ncbi:hypothetical protein STEG23_022312 [Scotinomys teguina]
MQPGRTTNTGGGTMEVVAVAPRLQLLLIVLVTVMLLLGMKVSPLLVRRKITRTIELQESIGKGCVYVVNPGPHACYSLTTESVTEA